jgi:hypothetical protein
MNPLNENLVSASIQCDFNTSIIFTIKEGFNMTGQVDDVEIDIISFKALFKTDQNLDSIIKKS